MNTEFPVQQWYLADVVERSENPNKTNLNPNSRCFTWVNTLLIKSNSFANAYDKAIMIAEKRYPQQFKAAAGNVVSWKVLGLSSLKIIEEELEDGAEITWIDLGHISVKRSDSLVKTKSEILSQ